jgi:hypothetical protein
MTEEANERQRIIRFYRRYVAFTLFHCNSDWLQREGEFHRRMVSRTLECIVRECQVYRPTDAAAEKAIVRRYAFVIAIEIRRRHFRRFGEVG